MRSIVRKAIHHAHAPFRRVLVFVLLAGIGYSVTIGAAHTHTDAESQLSNGKADLVAQMAFTPATTRHERSGEQECLICRLHQQLFNSTVRATLFASAPEFELVSRSQPDSFQYSCRLISARFIRISGRAPPSI